MEKEPHIVVSIAARCISANAPARSMKKCDAHRIRKYGRYATRANITNRLLTKTRKRASNIGRVMGGMARNIHIQSYSRRIAASTRKSNASYSTTSSCQPKCERVYLKLNTSLCLTAEVAVAATMTQYPNIHTLRNYEVPLYR